MQQLNMSSNTIVGYCRRNNIPLESIEDFRDHYDSIDNLIKSRLNLYKQGDLSNKFLYIIKNDFTQLTKIGSTNNYKQRIYQFELASGVNLEIILIKEMKNATALEYDLHAYFRKYRKIGEWFSLDNKNINEIINSLSIL